MRFSAGLFPPSRNTAILSVSIFILALAGCDREQLSEPADPAPDAVAEPAPSAVTTTVYVVRHAEKALEGDNPDLTEEGALRAASLIEELSEALTDLDNSYVLTTPYNRTRQTCGPTAEVKGLVLEEIEAEPAAAVSFIQELAPGSQALICGHSNTVPEILAGLGVSEPPALEDQDYGDLFVVTLAGGDATMERRRFGD